MITIRINQATIMYLTNDLEVKTFSVYTDKKINQKIAKGYVNDQADFNKIVNVSNKKVKAQVSLKDVKGLNDNE